MTAGSIASLPAPRGYCELHWALVLALVLRRLWAAENGDADAVGQS